MTLTNEQWKARLLIRTAKIKGLIEASLRKECKKYKITYNDTDTNKQLCTKLNNS